MLGIATTPGQNVFGVYGAGGHYGVYGNGYYGVYGNSSEFGVYGNGYVGVLGFGTDTGVLGKGQNMGVSSFSSAGIALYGLSYTGVLLHLEPTSGQPTTGIRSKGDLYVDSSGNLHIYNGTEWRTVTTTAG